MRQPRENLFRLLEPLLPHVEHPSRYLDHEWGACEEQDGPFHLCMVYADAYEVGQPNMGLAILYNAINAQEGMSCERAYLPWKDMSALMRQRGVPMLSLEGAAPLASFDAIGFTLAHELIWTNILEALDLAGIALDASERDEDDAIVLAGGPSAWNCEPLAPALDAVLLGDGEQLIVDVCKSIRDSRERGLSRAELLLRLSRIPGVYVPSLYEVVHDDGSTRWGRAVPREGTGAPAMVTKACIPDLSATPPVAQKIVPYMDIVQDRLAIEVLRGCARGCRFCQAGMTYRPVRERPEDQIVSATIEGLAESGHNEVSLTSLSTTDHSQCARMLNSLNASLGEQGIRVSIPSQRLDSFGIEMATAVAGGKRGGLTFAPEAGTQRLRDVINKNVTEDDLFGAIDAAFKAGWRRCKLYFMIGLPTETDDDIKGIASLVQRAYDRAKAAVPPEHRGNVRVSASVALFVPKSQTPFQWDGQIPPEEAIRRVNLLRNSVKYRAVDIHWHDPATSFVEAVMSRGGREAADWVEAAWRRGARFDAWTELFNEQAWRDAADELGLDPAAIAQAQWDTTRVMPWAHISSGVSVRYLALERKRADRGVTTPDCTFEKCTGCGACQALECDNVLMEPRSLPAKVSLDQAAKTGDCAGESGAAGEGGAR